MIFFICLVVSVFILYFIIIGISSWILSGAEENAAFNLHADEAVSVIIPFRNEMENLSGLIHSLSEVIYNPDKVEFILVDDHSEDGSCLLVSRLIQNKNNFRLLKSTGVPGKKYALLFAVQNSTYENIITSDADCVHQKFWLKHMMSAMINRDLVLLSGGVKYKDQNGFLFRFQALDFLSLVGMGAASILAGKAVMCNAANMAFKKTLFLDSFKHLHPEHPSGDDIFLLNFAKKNYPDKIAYCESKDAMVITSALPSFKKFFRQRIRWASKSIYYNDLSMIVLASVVFLCALFSLLLPLLSFINILYFYIFLALFSLKSLFDYIFLRIAAKKTEQTGLLRLYILSALVYPFYIFISATGGFFFNMKR